MTLPAGGRLGPYQVSAPLGAGGMGEVYRARDSRLGREVALKLLPADVASDAARLRRFEQEARAASALNHPNIVTVYEIGSADSTSYIALELVEGRTLRELTVSGPLPVKKTLDIALAVAEGLACAHEAGIVHRDLKPDNVMVSRDGVVKILDFGLAKRMPSECGAGQETATMSAGTEPGAVVGTVRYMSPEQATGRSVDFRSDQFSFGLVLYELLTGRAGFRRETNVDTLSAILHEEPESLASLNPRVPPPLRWIVERCLAKEPKNRYASTEDLARELATVRQHLPEVSSLIEPDPLPQRRRRLALRLGISAAAVAALAALGLVVSRSFARPPPEFRQLTFRSAGISTARFTPDEQTVIYSAQWEGSRPELFETRLDQPESRSLGLPSSQIFSVSNAGEMAIMLLPPFGVAARAPLSDSLLRLPLLSYGTLAQVPLVGGGPKELLENVIYADWAPNGQDLAVIHSVDSKDRVEFPIGKVLHECDCWLVNARVSPSGDRIAFQSGSTDVLVSDLSGRVQTLASGAWGLAWSPVTGELWYRAYGASSPGIGTTELHAITVSGRQRLVASLPGNFALHDISPSGRVLLARVVESAEIFGSFPGEARDRNFSNFDRSILWDVSASGDTILFGEMGMSRGETTAYIRKNDGSPAKRLGAFGNHSYAPIALSPDGRFALAEAEGTMILLPTGAGQAIPVPTPGVEQTTPLAFLAEGRSILFRGSKPGHNCRFWVQDLGGGPPRPVTPRCPRHPRPRLSGDGRFLCLREDSGAWSLYPIAGGEVHAVVGVQPGEEPIGGTPDGKWLYVRGADELRSGGSFVSARVYRLDPWTGRRELWKEIAPLSPTTGGGISTIRFSADGKTCFYTHHRYSSELFVADGLR